MRRLGGGVVEVRLAEVEVAVERNSTIVLRAEVPKARMC